MAGGTLEISSLSKTFESQQALYDVDFDVRPGEIHALVGQNGSGKSTLIKILAGFEHPDPGASARIGEEPIALGDAAAARAAHLCFVHQDLGLIETMSAGENIALGLEYVTGRGGRIRWREERERGRRALEAAGSQIDVNALVGDLVAVDRTTVAIARALAAAHDGGRFIILDEPTASLPRAEVARLFEVLRALATRGLGVVLVSHHLEEVLGVADRVTVLRDGVAVATVDAAGLDRDALAALIVGHAVEAHTGETDRRTSVPVLSVTGLTGGSLTGVDLSVAAGEIVGVAGIMGSGREDLAPLLFGAGERGGEVRVGDTLLPPDRPHSAIAAGMALVPANRIRDGLVPDMSIRENLTLSDLRPYWRGLRLRRAPEREDATGWVDRVGIQPPRLEAPVHSLSGGNQQKVLLAKWLRLEPSVLLLDEPTQGVDVGAKAEIYKAVERGAAAGAAVLVCSTDSEELTVLCDRIVVLRGGLVAAELDRGATADRVNDLLL